MGAQPFVGVRGSQSRARGYGESVHNATFSALFSSAGPFATVYIDVRNRTEDRHQVVDLRWAGVLDDLGVYGADNDTIDAIVDVVERTSAHTGTSGESLCVVASQGEVRLELHLPYEVDASASWGPVPRLLPAIHHLPDPVTHVLALVDRTKAEIHVPNGHSEQVLDVDGGSPLPVRKVRAGGWSMPRYQSRAEEGWRQNARSMAMAIEDAAESIGAEVIVVAGDVRERALVRDELSELSRREVHVMDEGALAAGADLSHLYQHVEQVLEEHRQQRLAGVLDRWRMGKSRENPTGIDGLASLVEVVRKGQVDTLMINCEVGKDWHLWVGDAPQQIGATQGEVLALGSATASRVNALEALVWSALGQGAHIMCCETEQFRDGIAALLRFTDPSTAELLRS